jgi:predicted DNA-binding transcriptional regulator AlpA
MTTMRNIAPTEHMADLLTVQEVACMLGCSTRSIARHAAQGRFPRGKRISNRLVRWDRAEVERHIATAC